MSVIYKKNVFRCKVPIDDLKNPFSVLVGGGAGSPPSQWNAKGSRYEFGFYLGGKFVTDISDIAGMYMTFKSDVKLRSGMALQEIGATTLDLTCTEADWLAGTKQHATFDLEGAAVNFDLGGKLSAQVYMALNGTTSDDPEDGDIFGWTNILMLESGIPSDTGPIQAGNLVPSGAQYDGSGHYSLPLTALRTYTWVDGGSHDSSLTNGTETVEASGAAFIAQTGSVVLNGSAETTVFAVVRNAGTLTPDQLDGRYVQGNNGDNDYRFVAGQLQLWDSGTGAYRAVTLVNGDFRVV